MISEKITKISDISESITLIIPTVEFLTSKFKVSLTLVTLLTTYTSIVTYK